MEKIMPPDVKTMSNFQHDPNYLTLSRMLARYQNLILLTPSPDEKVEATLIPWQKKIQAELWSPLPFHRTKWLRSIEGARTLLLKLEQSAQNIKIQRTKREVTKDLAQKRIVIKQLRSRVEEIGREVESSGGRQRATPPYQDDEQSESMLDVLQQIRRSKGQEPSNNTSSQKDMFTNQAAYPTANRSDESTMRDQVFASNSTVRRRQGKSVDYTNDPQGKSSGYSDKQSAENSLLEASKEHESVTSLLLSMATQLKQQQRQFQFTLNNEDKGLIDRTLEGLEQNVSAMGLASKGMKTLQRMSEEQGFWGRLKLQLLIGGMWMVAILLVFAGPKLRF